MDITAIQQLYGSTQTHVNASSKTAVNGDFDSVLQSAMGMVKETDSLQKNAQSEEIKFALGESDNTHDLMVAQSKATIALQYTVAVRDKILEAYKEIMNMQI